MQTVPVWDKLALRLPIGRNPFGSALINSLRKLGEVSLLYKYVISSLSSGEQNLVAKAKGVGPIELLLLD